MAEEGRGMGDNKTYLQAKLVISKICISKGWWWWGGVYIMFQGKLMHTAIFMFHTK